MKHTTLSDCLPLACIAALVASTACVSAFEDAKYIRNIDCAYHVLDDAFEHNDEAISRILEVGQGPVLIEEFVNVAAELGKPDNFILETGKKLRECIPPELLENVVAPPPAYGNKIVMR